MLLLVAVVAAAFVGATAPVVTFFGAAAAATVCTVAAALIGVAAGVAAVVCTVGAAVFVCTVLCWHCLYSACCCCCSHHCCYSLCCRCCCCCCCISFYLSALRLVLLLYCWCRCCGCRRSVIHVSPLLSLSGEQTWQHSITPHPPPTASTIPHRLRPCFCPPAPPLHASRNKNGKTTKRLRARTLLSSGCTLSTDSRRRRR